MNTRLVQAEVNAPDAVADRGAPGGGSLPPPPGRPPAAGGAPQRLILTVTVDVFGPPAFVDDTRRELQRLGDGLWSVMQKRGFVRAGPATGGHA